MNLESNMTSRGRRIKKTYDPNFINVLDTNFMVDIQQVNAFLKSLMYFTFFWIYLILKVLVKIDIPQDLQLIALAF